MKQKIATFLVLLAVAFSFSACKDKLDLTADYKDISISYGMLNPKDPVHYFKVYKGFLTDGNAHDAAMQWDNIYYPVDSIEVRLEEYKNGACLRSEVLDTTTTIDKEEGSFANPKQLLYYSTWQLDKEASYKLVIRKLATGEEVYAETLLVGDFAIMRPNSFLDVNFDKPYKIKFSGAPNAAAYDLYLNFHYIEVDNNTQAIEHKVITKKLNSDLLRLTGPEVDFNGFTPKTFYNFLATGIPVKENVTRYIDAVDNQPYVCMDLQIWAVNEVYATYKDVATPSSSIVQDRLEYTNFVSEDNNAYGFLASRNYSRRGLKFNNLEHNEDTLVLSPKTKKLNFDYYRNSPLFLDGPEQ